MDALSDSFSFQYKQVSRIRW